MGENKLATIVVTMEVVFDKEGNLASLVSWESLNKDTLENLGYVIKEEGNCISLKFLPKKPDQSEK